MIDFHIAAPSRRVGEKFAARARKLGFDIHVEKNAEGPDWTVWCSKCLIPSHSLITATETALEALAVEEGAWLDGWGASSG
jgi:regulator of RNase E activity RraB